MATIKLALTNSLHAGFDALLEKVKGDGVSSRMLGRILEDLAVAAPFGLGRSELLKHHTVSSLSKAFAILGESDDGSTLGLVRVLRVSAVGGRGGRPAERYLLGANRWAAIGVHVSVDDGQSWKVTGVLCRLNGERIAAKHRMLPMTRPEDNEQERPWQQVASDIALLVGELLQAYPGRELLGLGVEVPGHVYRREVLMANDGDRVAPLRLAGSIKNELVSQGLEDLATRVVLESDVNLIAIREAYNVRKPMSPHGIVVAVFDRGVSAGIFSGKRQLVRGSQGAAGELGHLPVFVNAGVPMPPKRPARPLKEREESGGHLPFDATCSCGGARHVDCFATPDRLLGELGLPAGRFAEIAGRPAYTSNGMLTDAGNAFWIAGSALGHGLLSLITTHNPDRLLVLLPAALAREGVLTALGEGDGTAAGLYRQALEHVLSAHAMTVPAEHARLEQDDDARGGWLEVRSLSPDEAGGAVKAARNASLGVIDAFIAHAVERDACAQQADLLPAASTSAVSYKREELKLISRELHELVIREDPEGLISDGAPRNEYSTEEAELLTMIKNQDVHVTEDRVLEVFAGFTKSALYEDRAKLRRLIDGITDLQTRFT